MDSTITAEDLKSMIQFYNRNVDDFLALSIGRMPYVSEDAEITVEQLQLLQSVMTNKIMTAYQLLIESLETEVSGVQ